MEKSKRKRSWAEPFKIKMVEPVYMTPMNTGKKLSKKRDTIPFC